MNKIFLLFLLVIFSNNTFSQTIDEKEIFSLDYKGNTELYNFIMDEASGNFCYAYLIPDEKKTFLISPKGQSEKYDFIMTFDTKFDSKGNYFTNAGNYESDYGIDNYFLIINGKTIKGLEYIESSSSFIDKKDEYVFIFKIKEDYFIGYAKADGSFRQSEKYDIVKPVYKYFQGRGMEGDNEQIGDEYFYRNADGERGFIVVKNGKAGLMFGEDIKMTDYSDIHESSLTLDNNNELTFIAKNGGKFYENAGDEFVVSGDIKYNSFDYVTPPVLFNKNNEPVYKASDSTEQFTHNKYLVKNNEKLPLNFEQSEVDKKPVLIFDIYDIKFGENDDITYFAASDEIFPANPEDASSYDEYYVKTYYVKNDKAFPIGYSTGNIIYDKEGNMIYAGISDLKKKEYLLMQTNGESIIIIGQGDYDLIGDYGFMKNGELYYFGQQFADEKTGKKASVKFFKGNNLTGEFENVSYQNFESGAVMIQFSPDGNGYVINAEDFGSQGNNNSYLVTENGKMDFPENTVSGSGKLINILNLMYTDNGKLFYTGITELDTTDYSYTEEIFTDNISLGKHYKQVQKIKYNRSDNTISFLGSRKNKIYSVTVRF